MSPRVLVIITGGTICMRPELERGVSMSGLRCSSLVEHIQSQPEFKNDALPEYDIHEWEHLVDSSDITPEHWKRMAEDIQSNYANYSAFVILHGTDTLAYTATALSFILEDLCKPVVITGAMLPMSHIHSDGKKNFTTSLLVAAFSGVHEVVVVFGSRILRGCRTTKVNCDSMDAFDSPNYAVLGRTGIDIQIDANNLRNLNERKNYLTIVDQPLNAGSVCIFKVTPSFNPFLLRHMAATEVRPLGVILELFGTGTAPICTTRFMEALEFAVRAGVIFVAVTQCVRGTCSLQTYANGVRLHDLGVIEAKDMTKEAALVKLAYLFSKGYTELNEIRTLMESNLRGEISESLMTITGQGTMNPIAAKNESSLEGCEEVVDGNITDNDDFESTHRLSVMSEGAHRKPHRASINVLKMAEPTRFFHHADFVTGVKMMTGCCRNHAFDDTTAQDELHNPPQ